MVSDYSTFGVDSTDTPFGPAEPRPSDLPPIDDDEWTTWTDLAADEAADWTEDGDLEWYGTDAA